MKILVISRNAWDDSNAIGNTISNFFGGIEDIEFASIYFRSASPNNTLCNHYYRTTEAEVMKKWFCKEKIGKEFYTNENDVKNAQKNSTGSKEKNLIRVIQKHSLKFAYKLSDYLWYSEKWMNENLRSFVESYSPDVVFSFVKSAPQYYLTVKYLRENFDIPLLSWIADDEYTSLKKKNSKKELQNLEYILKESSIVLGCSQEICDYYNSIFYCDAKVLYKGCDLSTPIKKKDDKKIKIVYAGNLLYGRLEILKKVSDILEDYNNNEVCFDIYSNTALLPNEIQNTFGSKKCTNYLGRQDYEIIKSELESADIVLHVESFDEEQMLKTKYSFSTKIIDCLQSGSVMLSIGPKDLSSIKYVEKIDGTCVIDALENLENELVALLDDKDSFFVRAQKIRQFAQKHHDSVANAQEVKKILTKIKKEES